MASLPEGFPKIIGQLKERGIIFAAASGRQYHNLRQLFAPVKDDIAYICENGALTIYQGEVLHKVVIPPETAIPIIRRLEEEPGTVFTYVIPKCAGWSMRPLFYIKPVCTF